jgi:hypothetical protein
MRAFVGAGDAITLSWKKWLFLGTVMASPALKNSGHF